MSSAGAVYVLSHTSGVWSQNAYVKASNPGTNDSFGVSVAVSADGTSFAVGAFGEASSARGVGGSEGNNTAPGAGAAYTFRRTGVSWAQDAYIKASNAAANSAFGFRIALSGNGLVLSVGAPGESSSARGIDGNQLDMSADGAGAVYVFRRSGGWAQEAYVKASNTDASDVLGRVALSAEGTLAVGAIGEASTATDVDGNQSDNSASRAGAVYTYRF